MIERHEITDNETWLGWRKNDITASTIGALVGNHPYETALGLFVAKSGFELPPLDSDVLWRGLLYESAVAMAAGQKHPEWKITKANEYLRDPEARIGATPDFYVEGDPRGRMILQAKTVAPREFKANWTDDQPPFWISLQTICEAMLDDAALGIVAALVVDPYRPFVQLYEVPRHPGAEARLRSAVAQFWQDVKDGREPNPDYGRDSDLLAALYPSEVPLKAIDLISDNRLPEILAERADIKKRMKADEARCKEIETEVKFKLGDAEIGTLLNWHITWKTQRRAEHWVKASEFRVMRISDRRPSL